MCRKYLQMEFTIRPRRFINYKCGKKYYKNNQLLVLEKGMGDLQQIHCTYIYLKKWKEAEVHKQYSQLKHEWKLKNG